MRLGTQYKESTFIGLYDQKNFWDSIVKSSWYRYVVWNNNRLLNDYFFEVRLECYIEMRKKLCN